LLISNINYGGNYYFSPLQLTDNTIKDHGYTILEANHGIIIININHLGTEANDGSIYISDYTG